MADLLHTDYRTHMDYVLRTAVENCAEKKLVNTFNISATESKWFKKIQSIATRVGSFCVERRTLLNARPCERKPSLPKRTLDIHGGCLVAGELRAIEYLTVESKRNKHLRTANVPINSTLQIVHYSAFTKK